MKMRIKSLAALILTICILSACGSSGSGQTSDAPNETISEMESKEEKESEAASQGQTTVVKDNRRKKEDAATEDQEKPKTETPVIAPEDLEIR
ncbi:MAG: hypothetical protein IKI23_09760, partial [Lachnospiraceae bacterium]|nr:hypothetical protein [Lachnospiraceae bacterium]